MDYANKPESTGVKLWHFSRWIIGISAFFCLIDAITSAYLFGNGSITLEPVFQTCLLFAVLGYVQEIYFMLKTHSGSN